MLELQRVLEEPIVDIFDPHKTPTLKLSEKSPWLGDTLVTERITVITLHRAFAYQNSGKLMYFQKSGGIIRAIAAMVV